MVFTLPQYETGLGIRNCEEFEMLVDLLGFSMQEVVSHEKGINSYKYKITLGEYIKFGIHGPKNRNSEVTHMLDMTGEACRDFEKRGGNWEHLLQYCFINGWKFTRIDIANDIIVEDTEEEYLFDLDTLVNKYINNEYASSGFNDSTIILGKKNSDASKLGTSITFGSRNSQLVLQIYDKKQERKARNENNTDTSKMYVWASSWIRFEFRIKQGKAADFVDKLIKVGFDKLSNLFSSILKESLSFKYRPGYVPNDLWKSLNGDKAQRISDKNTKRFRWITCPWWEEHIGNVEALKLVNQYKLEASITKSKDWVNRSVSRNLTKIAMADPEEFIDFLTGVLQKGREKITEKEITQIEDYREQFSKDELEQNKMFQKLDSIIEQIRNLSN